MPQRGVGTMKLKTLRRPGVRDLSSMFDKAGAVSTEHLTWADESGLESLLDLLDHEHPKIRAMAEEFTANLKKEKHDINVVKGGFSPLSDMLKYKNLEAQKCALWTIGTLAGNNEATHENIIAEIGWHTIIRRTKSDIADIQRIACNIIANLSLNDNMHGHIMNDGGIDALKTLAQRDDLQLQRACCNAFANLCTNRDNIHGVIKDGGLETIIEFAKSDDEELKTAALHTLANLADDPELRRLIVEKGGLDPVISNLESSQVVVLRGASAAVANLAEEHLNHPEMLQRGTIEKLVVLARRCKVFYFLQYFLTKIIL